MKSQGPSICLLKRGHKDIQFHCLCKLPYRLGCRSPCSATAAAYRESGQPRNTLIPARQGPSKCRSSCASTSCFSTALAWEKGLVFLGSGKGSKKEDPGAHFLHVNNKTVCPSLKAVLSREYLSRLLQGTGQSITETAMLLPVGTSKKQTHAGALFNRAGTGEMPTSNSHFQTYLSHLKLLPCPSAPLGLTPVEKGRTGGELCLVGPSCVCRAAGNHPPSTHSSALCPPGFPTAGP